MSVAEQAAKLAEARLDATSAPDIDSIYGDKEPPKSRLKPILASDLVKASYNVREPIMGNWLRQKDIAEVFAWRGTGKTWFLTALAVTTAAGKNLFGWDAGKPRRVVYVEGELPVQDVQDRLRTVAASFDCPEALENITVLSRDLHEDGFVDINEPADQELLDRIIELGNLLILDSLATLSGAVSESDPESWKTIQPWLLKLRSRGVTTIFAHHAGKGGDQRGISNREDVLSAVIKLSKPKDADPTALGFDLEFTKDRCPGPNRNDIKPISITMREDHTGTMLFSWRLKGDANKERALEMKEDGMTVRDIADELGISKSQVHRLIKGAP